MRERLSNILINKLTIFLALFGLIYGTAYAFAIYASRDSEQRSNAVQDKCSSQGYEAARAGLPVEACQYDGKGLFWYERRCWIEGWQRFHIEKAKQ